MSKSNPTRQCSRDCAPVIEIPEISHLSTIIRNRDKLRNYDSLNSCSKRRTCVHEDFDEAVMKWIHTMQDKNVLISEPFVIEKAFPFVKVPIAELAERWTELPQVSDESRSFFIVYTGYFSNIPKCIKAEFIASWACSQSSVVSSSQR
ncbi:tigger transposable element-derived protein 6 [Trichonephila clavipes]|nr:tigger transposable element-derived protein 6 [Trichonephila clavipes]